MTKGKVALRILSFIMKIILVIVLVATAFVVGTMIGYGIIGDGDPFAVFQRETWEHIFQYFVGPSTAQ